MLHQNYVTQPIGGINYLSLFKSALEHRPFDGFDVAVAYATVSGVKELTKAFSEYAGEDWKRIQKRWLVGIDYCRTEPLAIQMLEAEQNSIVKIHEGVKVIERKNCTPLLPFHPKAFLFRAPNSAAIVSGSGNLSRNGLTKGHEVGSVLVVRDPSNEIERKAHKLCEGMNNWFNGLWSPASSARTILEPYEDIFKSVENLKMPVPTDDDGGESETLVKKSRKGTLNPLHLRQLRVCQNFWIEAGNITKNRGEELPGNQLMMTRMSRVFFGVSPTDVPKDTTIGTIDISYNGRRMRDFSLRFGNNGMDILGLPIPGDGGPDAYDNENLLFERLSDGSFKLTLGNAAQKTKWKRMSEKIDALHKMQKSNRLWGVY